MEIPGKVAIVTGAGSGIGRASAVALAKAGASVVVADIDESGGNETVHQAVSAGGKATFVPADVSTPAGVQGLFDAATALYGGVDIVHNNAGIMSGGAPNWPDTTLDRIYLVLSVNTAGVLMGTAAAIAAMRKRGGGAVVNTASIAGLGAMPFDPVYAASKAAVINFTQSCAMLKETENIRVNAVLPGMVDTPIIAKTGDGTKPAEWLGPALDGATLLTPEAIAEAVIAFIRDDAKAGETLVIMHGVAAPA